MKTTKFIGAGLLTAIASSLCCITPVLALISGTTGVASTFSWLEPYRPYLIVFTITVLGFAWYQKLKPKKDINCNCDSAKKPSFFQSKLLLAMVTVFAFTMTVFPYFSSVFYPKNNAKIVIVDDKQLQNASFSVKGMTCTSCERNISQAIHQLDGIVSVSSSYESERVEVEYDKAKTTPKKIEKAITKTGYTVTKTTQK